MALKQIELEVPTTLSDIKLWQYQKYMKVIEQKQNRRCRRKGSNKRFPKHEACRNIL